MSLEEKRLKLAIIAGASHALRYRNKNPKVSDDQVIQHVSKEVNSILDNLDKDLN